MLMSQYVAFPTKRRDHHTAQHKITWSVTKPSFYQCQLCQLYKARTPPPTTGQPHIPLTFRKILASEENRKMLHRQDSMVQKDCTAG
jgi:hypothetical protein